MSPLLSVHSVSLWQDKTWQMSTHIAPHLLIQRAVLHSWQDTTFEHRARVNFHDSPNKHSFYLFLCYYRCTVILKHLNVLFCLNKTFQGEPTSYKSSQNQLIEVWRYTQGLWGSLGVHRFCLCSPGSWSPAHVPFIKAGLQQIAVPSAGNSLLMSHEPMEQQAHSEFFFFSNSSTQISDLSYIGHTKADKGPTWVHFENQHGCLPVHRVWVSILSPQFAGKFQNKFSTFPCLRTLLLECGWGPTACRQSSNQYCY